jgi:uncharacterized RDD family membrane protein YckC
MNATQDTGVVTPEAVVLGFENAGVGSRSAAAVLDIMLLGVFAGLVAIATAVFGVGAGSSWVGVLVLTVAGFITFYGYSALFEGFMGGRTPGKAALGLRVLTVEGTPIRFRHAAIRAALGLVEIFGSAGIIGLVAIFVSKKNQRLGDMAAGTVVVRERVASAMPISTTFVPPPTAEAFTASLDVTALTTADYQMVRSFLSRAAAMDAKARFALAGQLATAMVAKLRIRTPEGMPAELFLICVAAAYQRRRSH